MKALSTEEEVGRFENLIFVPIFGGVEGCPWKESRSCKHFNVQISTADRFVILYFMQLANID